MIALDTRGQGKSSFGGDQHLDFDLLACDVLCVMDVLKIKKSAHTGF